jgi:hypothetical protein
MYYGRWIKGEVKVKIVKPYKKYILELGNVNVMFDTFTKDGTSLYLWCGNELACTIYGDDASEFYRAWRVM